MKRIYLIIILVFTVGLGLGFSVNVSGEESLIPSWIKSIASFWVDGKIGDQEFIQALQYLVKERVLVIPQANVIENNSPKDSQSLVDLEVISCNHHGIKSREVQYSITSHYSTIKNIELALKGVDSNGKVMSVYVKTMYDVVPNHITYDYSYIDDHPDIVSCEIGVN